MGNYTGSVPDTAGRPLDWMERAACTDKRTIFDDPKREHEARTICVAHCPVRTQCLAYTKESERGLHRDQRDGVAAGLTYDERHRLDDTAAHRADDAAPIRLDGTERCGTHVALLRHLWLDEPIDSKCWSGEVYRHHSNRGWRQRTGYEPDPDRLPEAS
ncbi:WhiB family transcriptional regulator [Streptomyces caeni]|uniref:WhiB family transcriptional regulator n=1 Tax=Streptomyces caeni TaxID=2307231 RepID=A0ABW4ILC5_9ACTN